MHGISIKKRYTSWSMCKDITAVASEGDNGTPAGMGRVCTYIPNMHRDR